MHWEKLLSLKRFGDSNKRIRKEQDETRLGFEVDYDRIVFSSEFRSLQDKTQVIPLSKTDFVHTRLTHSLEVSVVGRTLGRLVGKQILSKYPHLEQTLGYRANDFGAIVATAALAHDIGNPPFGHSGEKAIGEFFRSGYGSIYKEKFTTAQYEDLCNFEGNANGFKILTEDREGREGGLRLSYATLGAFMKYPKESLPKRPTGNISDKKFGIFQSETNIFYEVADELGLLKSPTGNGFRRHPLAFLVEAADDICYTIIDFEDGINLGLIEEEHALEFMIKLVKDSINKNKYASLITKRDRVSYLRALSINTLINEAVRIFLDNEEKILNGTFNVSLLEGCGYAAQMNDIIKISIDKIYNSDEVLHKEIAGYEVLQGLLETFVKSYENYRLNNSSSYDNLILKVFGSELQLDENDPYRSILSICNYISKLSDGNAILTYKRIKGNVL